MTSSQSSRARTYRSELRAEQAAHTRARVVAAAATLFSASGFQATTLAAIARAAGVSVETVKAGASKAELLIASFEVAFAGEEARDSLVDAPTGEGVLGLADDLFLDAVITRIAQANDRAHALWTVVLGAALSDPVVATAVRGMLDRRAADFRRLVSELVRRGIGAADLDVETAAAELSFVMSPEGYQQLVAQWRWTPAQYRSWLTARIHAIVDRASVA